jgi:general secretion pathway protein J
MRQLPDRAYGRKLSGMTLLEVMIALVIFTIVAAAGYSGLHQGVAVQQQLQAQQEYWSRLDAVMVMIEQDLSQARKLAPRVPLWDTMAFRGYANNTSEALGEVMKFTRGGNQSFREGSVSPYRRLSYQLRDGALYRTSQPGINLPESERGVESELLKGVDNIQLRYLQANHNWADSWPIRFTVEDSATLPRAVELTLYLENDISYKRLFYVGAPL